MEATARIATRFGLPTLAQKHCIISGGSKGIGAAIAARFAAEGAHVTILSQNAARLEQASTNLNKYRVFEGQQLRTFRGDMTQEKCWRELYETEAPPPDVLVNCIGVRQEKVFTRMHEADSKLILDTNLHSAILGCQHTLKNMISHKRQGCIINVSSLLAMKGVAGTSVYAASKAGLIGLTTSLAVEHARYKIRVNALVPGYIDTDMTKDLKHLQQSVLKIPLERLGTVNEVADAAHFLATNPYANNCILNLDGGLSAT